MRGVHKAGIAVDEVILDVHDLVRHPVQIVYPFPQA